MKNQTEALKREHAQRNYEPNTQRWLKAMNSTAFLKKEDSQLRQEIIMLREELRYARKLLRQEERKLRITWWSVYLVGFFFICYLMFF